jgi:3-oxoacyl-[acyl-carrier-protein] synthase-1
MTAMSLRIEAAGLIASVGLSRAAVCAAMRAKVANPCELRYHDDGNEPLIGHRVDWDRRVRGVDRLAQLGAWAVRQCLEARPALAWSRVPLLLCLAERGRADGPDERPAAVARALWHLLPPMDAARSALFEGPTGMAAALLRARHEIEHGTADAVLVAATDSLLHHACLSHFEAQRRLLTSRNSDGFMPGEGAAALLVTAHGGSHPGLRIAGIGMAHEPAHVDSGEPLRADGLRDAMRHALEDAGAATADFDYTVSDAAGEQYAFKEGSLAVSRTLRVPKATFEFWQPAESVGHCGAALPLMALALADDAAARGYAPGRWAMLHFGDDGGSRSAIYAAAS